MDGYIRLSTLAVEHGVVVLTAGSQSRTQLAKLRHHDVIIT